MIIKTKKDNENVLSMAGLTGDKLLNSENLEFVKLRIEAGNEIAPHAMPIKVIFYLVSGQGELYFDGESYIIEQGTIIECESQKERGWKNIGKEILEVLVIKIS